jgi:hypothetical protein
MQCDDWKHKMPWFERDSELRLRHLQAVVEREKECLCSFPFLVSKTILAIVFAPFSPTRVFLRLRYGTHRLLSEAFFLYVGPGALADSRLITRSKTSSFLTGITLQARCRSCKMQVRTNLGRKAPRSHLHFGFRHSERTTQQAYHSKCIVLNLVGSCMRTSWYCASIPPTRLPSLCVKRTDRTYSYATIATFSAYNRHATNAIRIRTMFNKPLRSNYVVAP